MRATGARERSAPFAVEMLHLAEAHVRVDHLLRRVDLLLGDDLFGAGPLGLWCVTHTAQWAGEGRAPGR